MTQAPERPCIGPLNTRVNLDEVFGYVCENVISDNVTPYKLIVAELIHLLRELDPCDNVFFREEVIMMQSMIYGLINREDMPFEDVKRCIRHLDKYIRSEMGIYAPFMKRMSAKLDSNISIKMTFNEPPSTADTRRSETASKSVVYRSPLHLFTQKLYVAGCYLTQQQQFEMQEKLKDYIRGTWPIQFKGRTMLPFEINTSIRARQWIRKQMHLHQICPSEAMYGEQLFNWCHDISARHKDIPEVHLLKMIAHIGNEDFHGAQKSLRRFFDFSVFRPNTGGVQNTAATLSRLGVPDQRPFRFGPLLSARLHRVFGDRLMCRQLLQECMREAQASQDNICYKFVYMELILLLCHYYCREEQQLDRHICIPKEPALEKTICMSDVFQLPDRCPSVLADRDPEEHLHSSEMYLSAATQLADAIERLKYGTMDGHDFSNQFADSVTLDDRDGKSRLLHEAGVAVLISFRMKQGFYKSARNTAQALIESNGNDGVAPRHETEAQVIAHINICYADAIHGDWAEALRKIEELAQTYQKKVFWRLSKHINLAVSCLKFNDFIRQGKLDDCEDELMNLEKFSYQEWFLKKTLLLAIRGRLEEAISMLEEETGYFERIPRLDLTYSSRVHMQLALFEARLNPSIADKRFNNLCAIQTKSNNRLIIGMIKRRMSTASINVGCPSVAKKLLEEEVFKEECLDNNYLELGLAHLTMGAATLYTDNNACSIALTNALRYLSSAGYPIIEKVARKLQAGLYLCMGNEEEMAKSLEAFCKLDDDYPGYIDWTLL